MRSLIIPFDDEAGRFIDNPRHADHIGGLFTNCNLTPLKPPKETSLLYIKLDVSNQSMK